MQSRVPTLLRSADGVSTWASLAAATSHSAVDRAVASGAAVLALPGVLVEPGRLDDDRVRRRAALAWGGEGALLSHTTALSLFGLPVPSTSTVHLVVPHTRRRTTRRDLALDVVVHRSRSRPPSSWRQSLPLVSLETAVVQSWPLLQGSDQRAPTIVAVQRRSTTAAALRTALDRQRVLDQRPALQRLVTAVEAGCRSELELWGYERVFTGAPFESLVRQVEMVVQGRLFVLDCYDKRAALAIELDGRQYHDSARQRERDAARDALVAGAGIQTVRFPHSRLTGSPTGCRDDAARVLETRRAQLEGRRVPRVVTLPPGPSGSARLGLELPGPASS